MTWTRAPPSGSLGSPCTPVGAAQCSSVSTLYSSACTALLYVQAYLFFLQRKEVLARSVISHGANLLISNLARCNITELNLVQNY